MTLAVERRGTSVTRACHLVGIPRSTYYYESTPRAEKPVDPVLRGLVLEIAQERPSFGYRRMAAMVRRALQRAVNTKAVRRIMKKENLTLEPCVQPPRARIPKHPGKQLMEAPDLAYQLDLKYVWCGSQDGWGYLQNVVECCTSEWLGHTFGPSCGAAEANALLDRIVMGRFPTTRNAPGTRLRVDNGPAYKSRAFIQHATQLGFVVEHIQKKTPEDNGVVESFHAGLDRDYLNLVGLDAYDLAGSFISEAFVDYNTVKPKQRLGWKTPKEYLESLRSDGIKKEEAPDENRIDA